MFFDLGLGLSEYIKKMTIIIVTGSFLLQDGTPFLLQDGTDLLF